MHTIRKPLLQVADIICSYHYYVSLQCTLHCYAGVIVGTVEGSSLLLDESRSQLNRLVTDKITSNAWEHVSFIEINNVCDGGPQLWEALKAMP